MKKLIILALATLLMVPAFAQNKKSQSKSKAPAVATAPAAKADAEGLDKVYDEDRDPMEMLETALEEARATDRLVLAQVGGNWCSWCLRFAKLVTTDEEIASVIKENYVYVHINVPKEKDRRSPDVMKRLGNPGRFGYPALVVLDGDGQVLHIENSSYLEQDKGYNRKSVLQFFQNWTRKAIEDIR